MCISWISLIEPAFPWCMSCQFEWPRFSESHSAGIEKGSGTVVCWSIYLALGRWVICLKIVPSETKKILCWTPLLSKWTNWQQVDERHLRSQKGSECWLLSKRPRHEAASMDFRSHWGLWLQLTASWLLRHVSTLPYAAMSHISDCTSWKRPAQVLFIFIFIVFQAS